MKISEKQFKGKSFTFAIPYLGDIMARGEDTNGKKKFRLAGKEGLKIIVNGIDISNEVYIDTDLTIKASDARYYHDVEKFFFANVTNVTLDSNDSIQVTGFFEQSEIDYLSGSTGAPAWAAAGGVVTTSYTFIPWHYYQTYSAIYGVIGMTISDYDTGEVLGTISQSAWTTQTNPQPAGKWDTNGDLEPDSNIGPSLQCDITSDTAIIKIEWSGVGAANTAYFSYNYAGAGGTGRIFIALDGVWGTDFSSFINGGASGSYTAADAATMQANSYPGLESTSSNGNLPGTGYVGPYLSPGTNGYGNASGYILLNNPTI